MDINWINTSPVTVTYNHQGIKNPIETLIARFENEFNVNNGNNIGGLIVYNNSCVYDYENFCGWLKPV